MSDNDFNRLGPPVLLPDGTAQSPPRYDFNGAGMTLGYFASGKNAGIWVTTADGRSERIGGGIWGCDYCGGANDHRLKCVSCGAPRPIVRGPFNV